LRWSVGPGDAVRPGYGEKPGHDIQQVGKASNLAIQVLGPVAPLLAAGHFHPVST
jgi:hypothetical protein